MRGFLAAVSAVFVLSGVAIGASAQPTPSAIPAESRVPDVFVVGDSISDGGGAEIDAAFGAEGWKTGRIARGGKAVVDMRPFIRNVAAVRKPDVMVIELGTNDMGGVALADDDQPAPSGDEERAAYANAVAQLERALQDMRNVPCVVWINVSDWSNLDFGPGGRYDLVTWAPPYNRRLEEAAKARRNVHVVDYAAEIRTKGLAWIANNFDDDWMIHPDTPAGKREVASIMVDGVKRVCGL